VARYILRRLIISLATIWAIATVCFFLIRLLPGNPFIVANPLDMTNAEKMMSYYGLDKPLLQQYVVYLGNLVRLDFGYSLKNFGLSVNSAIATYFPITCQLALQALCFGLPTGTLLGIIASVKRGGAVDYSIGVMTILTVALPQYVLAALLQLLFSVKLGWLPVSMWTSFRHTILPTLVLSIGLIAYNSRAMRTLMLEVGQQDYLRTAKAKGLGRVRITNLGLEVAGLLMGSYVIERVFTIPGLGKYFVDSITSLDYTMALGLAVFQAVVVVFVNFAVDILYCLIDPRVSIA
jgi:oligopeptide transport system permease protein